MRPLFLPRMPRDAAEELSLVLSSAGIQNRAVRGPGGWMLLVPPALHARAMEEIRAFDEENPLEDEYPGRGEGQEQAPAKQGFVSGVYAALLLAAVYAASGPMEESRELLRALGALSPAVKHGQVFRLVTALTLHVDVVHLVGNMAGIALFGGAVAAVAGRGAGWLLVVAGGVGGNLATALVHTTPHLSVGASTSVFAAIGILGGFRLIRPGEGGRRGARPWVILGAGLALLGLLGSGPRSDLLAHLFGYLCGVGLGLAYAKAFDHPPGKRVQAAALGLVVLLLAGSWAWGYAAF
ncbi:MAG: rhomboid family intramembrane serine protease [Deltaproteobacteria bacterium]|nr:rhomboid family intramembrane serine protease [Deltaproteobacteria bacterium]